MIQLVKGDCLEKMKDIKSGSVDMVLTSPPYDNLREYGKEFTKWGCHIWKPCIDEIYRTLKIGGVSVWIVGDATIKGSETGTSFKQALYAKDVGFNLHDTMIWNKPNPIPRTHKRYEQAFEYMFIFTKGKIKTFNPLMIPCKNAGKKRSGTIQQKANGLRTSKNKGGLISKTKQACNVWDLANSEKSIHPAVFPLRLAEDHIISWSNEGSTVLDPFMGSGTTGVACKNLNRSFIGIEQDDKYFEIAKERIENIEPSLFGN